MAEDGKKGGTVIPFRSGEGAHGARGAWPKILQDVTHEIEHAYRQDRIADGHLWVFGLSMLYKSMHHLPVEDRLAKFDELMTTLNRELFPPLSDTPPETPTA